MIKGKFFVVLIMMVLPLFLSGCVDKENLAEIENTQKEILAKLDSIEERQKKIEENQKNMSKVFQPRRPTVDYNKVHNLPVGSSAVKGNREAPVSIVEFSDFQCPYCARLQGTLKQVLDTYPDDVKLVFKDFPLSFHKQATNAAKAARAAGEQGKYWEMHDLIFANFNKLNENSFKEFADKLNLDKNKFTADFESNKYDALIQEDIKLGRDAGVSGTPTLFINGKRMKGRSLDDFKSMIDELLKKK